MSQIFNSVILPCESVEEQNQKQEQKQKQKQDVEVYHGIRIYPLRFGIYRSRYSTSMIGRNSSRVGRSAAFAKYVTQHPVYFGISTLFYMRTLGGIIDDFKIEYDKKDKDKVMRPQESTLTAKTKNADGSIVERSIQVVAKPLNIVLK